MENRAKAVLTAKISGPRGFRVVGALGEPDDHLRLAVLLSLAAERRSDNRKGLDLEASRTCRAPTTSWPARYEALKRVLESAQPQQIAFADVDALQMGHLTPEHRWDDGSFAREREKTYRLVLQAGARLNWLFLRPVREAQVTLDLQDAGVRTEPWATGDSPNEDPAVLDRLAPELRPLARWLLDGSYLAERDLERLLDESREDLTDSMVVDVVYNCLPGPTRDVARRLAQLRQPSAANGRLGPFAVTASPGLSTEIRTTDLRRLEEAGILQSAGGGANRLHMPRLVRKYLSGGAVRKWG